MRLTQGAFSFLPDLSDEQIAKQVKYCLDNGWAVNVEYTDDPHPRNSYWEMWGHPMFDLKDPAGVMLEVNECRKTFPNHYVRLSAFDDTRGIESVRLSFIQPAGRRAGFPTGAYRNLGASDSLYHQVLRRARAFRPALRLSPREIRSLQHQR